MFRILVIFIPAVFIGQETNFTFNASMDFKIIDDYRSSISFSNSLFSIPFSLNQQNIRFNKYENSISKYVGNNNFYKAPYQENKGIDNLAANLFIGLAIEICRAIETPQISFCP